MKIVKEKLGFVANSFEEEMKKAATSADLEKSWKLPNDAEIIVGSERFRCCEALFNPAYAGLNKNGTDAVQTLVAQTVEKYCDWSLHKELYANIVLSGGTAQTSGFSARLCKELSERAGYPVKIKSDPAWRYGAWKGGSQIAHNPLFKGWISKDVYDEEGPSIAHRERDTDNITVITSLPASKSLSPTKTTTSESSTVTPKTLPVQPKPKISATATQPSCENVTVQTKTSELSSVIAKQLTALDNLTLAVTASHPTVSYMFLYTLLIW